MTGRGRVIAAGLVALAIHHWPTMAATAGEWDVSGSVAGELRVFPFAPRFEDQDDVRISPSIAFEPELVYSWGGGANRLTFKPYLRLDRDDDNRSHGDIREANWLHQGRDWSLVVGLDKVFWGVTESRHLVDIINQTDAVDDIDNEDKLGQPMVNLTLLRNWGTLGIFVLPGFRERTFAGNDDRLRGPKPIDDANPIYESGAREWHVDYALRWAHNFAEWDIGIAHFYGTSREPLLKSRTDPDGGKVFVPQYDLIHQTSLDLQYTSGAWLWKLEAMTRTGHGHTFFASVAGFEYTLFHVFQGSADLGLLAEYQYDGRNQNAAPGTASDDDIFLGTRLTLNDAASTALLAGTVVDRSSGALRFFVEAERRIWGNWKAEIEGRFFVNIPDDDLGAGIRDDDVITLRLSYFF